jgi:hypothetical protein
MTRAAYDEAEPAEPNVEWVASVQSDLRKASERFGSLLRKEAEANMAVFLAEQEVEAAGETRQVQATHLKQRHVEAVAVVNRTEAALADELADSANRERVLPDPDSKETADATSKLAPLLHAYQKALQERAHAIHFCTTQTLAARQALLQVTKKRDACKRHLIDVVSDRNEAESEMTRIHTMLVDKVDTEQELLALQLGRVAPASTPLMLAEKCMPTCFGEQCAISHDVFKLEG